MITVSGVCNMEAMNGSASSLVKPVLRKAMSSVSDTSRVSPLSTAITTLASNTFKISVSEAGFGLRERYAVHCSRRSLLSCKDQRPVMRFSLLVALSPSL